MDWLEFIYKRVTEDLALGVAIPLIVVLAIAVRWDLGLNNACLLVGRTLAPHIGGTGLQDAVTPPWRANVFLALWALVILILGAGFFRFTVFEAIGLIVLFFAVVVLAGVFLIPKPDSPHYIRMIYSSLANRFADFKRDNDLERAGAAQSVLNDLTAKFGDKLTS